MHDNDQTVRVTLRIPADLHEKLTATASKSNRSMNAEIVERLESSLSETSNQGEQLERFKAAATEYENLTKAQQLVLSKMGRIVSEMSERIWDENLEA